jgi:hypothetical protein
MKSVRYLTIIIVSIALLGSVSVAQSPTVPAGRCRHFPKTGHYVCDKFLDFFETRGSLEIFGYPTTEAFIDPTHSGLRVQYFQRARMEEHPYNQPPYDVQLGLLVDELGHIYPPADQDELPDPDDASHHYFPETQHVVSYAFLDFFHDHGGLDIFGYPRSEMVYEEGLVVQYFQRARMEWHHSRAPGQQIVLTNMGERYIKRFDVPGDVELPLPPPARGETTETAPSRPPYRAFLPLILASARPGTPPPSPIRPSPTAPSTKATELEVSASVRYPITGRTGTQTAFIYVNDQDGRPIARAEVILTVHYQPDEVTCTPRPTDGSGFTRCSFDIPSPPVGERVVIDVTVTYEGLTATTQTFFMPWW